MLTREFLREFRRKCELNWSTRTLQLGSKIGSHWNPGLSESEIADYERTVGFHLPEDIKAMLREMNGSGPFTGYVYGHNGPERVSFVGVYSFPKDLGVIQIRIEDVRLWRSQIAADLAQQNFDLPDSANLLPIYGHRYVLCTAAVDSSLVLSILAQEQPDAIVYANSLQEYLEKEFLH